MEVITGVLPFNETNIFAVNDTASQLWVDHNIVPFYPQVNFVAITVRHISCSCSTPVQLT